MTVTWPQTMASKLTCSCSTEAHITIRQQSDLLYASPPPEPCNALQACMNMVHPLTLDTSIASSA